MLHCERPEGPRRLLGGQTGAMFSHGRTHDVHGIATFHTNLSRTRWYPMHRQPVRILLIDDSASFVAAFSAMLGEAPLSCPVELSTATTEDAALQFVAETPPDIVFLCPDYAPGGWTTLTGKIKYVDCLIPIVIITDADHEDTARRAIENDAADYLIKEEITSRDIVHAVRYARGNRHNQEKLQRTSNQWRATFDSIPDWILILDLGCGIVKVNKALADSFGRHPREIVRSNCRGLIGEVDWPCEECPHTCVIESGAPRITDIFNRRLSIFQVVTTAPLLDGKDRIVGTTNVVKDISEKKRAELERETLIAELREALSRVKTLSGLLPICASCKRIRDDRGSWNPIEVYIHDRSNAQFSHGICPDCARKLYPDYFKSR
jgi:PAS domain S-box-containing protein